MNRIMVTAIIMSAISTGCTRIGPLSTPAVGITVVSRDAMPSPGGADISDVGRPYYIGAFDKLKIDVFGVEEFARDVQTDASGNFLYPLIGLVEAGGKTPFEVASLIEARLRGKFVRNPSVTVNLEESLSQLVTIDGEVKKPGSYPVQGKMTLLKAIAAAEGTAQFASLEDVVIFRMVDKKKYAGLYNLAAIRRGTYEDPEIFANDVVVVGDSPGRRLFQDLLQASPLLTTPLIILAQQ